MVGLSCFLTLWCIKAHLNSDLSLVMTESPLVTRSVFQPNEREPTQDANEGFLLPATLNNVYEEEELFTLIFLGCKCSCFKREKKS